MEPFSKDDPLYDLLGKTKPVEPRPNFTQNVMRSIRNTPQERKLGWLASLLVKISEKLHLQSVPTPALASAAVAAALVVGFFILSNPSESEFQAGADSTPTLASHEPASHGPAAIEVEAAHVSASFEQISESEVPEEAAVASELDSMDQLSDLLASQDTSSLTDGEIAMLLY